LDVPKVDFTLDDVEARMRRVVKLEIMESEGRIKREIKGYIDTTHGELKTELKADTHRQFDGVNKRLDHIEHELKGVKRVVNQHSVEILELKAQARLA
jgi:hypothetical protein